MGTINCRQEVQSLSVIERTRREFLAALDNIESIQLPDRTSTPCILRGWRNAVNHAEVRRLQLIEKSSKLVRIKGWKEHGANGLALERHARELRHNSYIVNA